MKTVMIKSNSNLTIYARIFVVFTLLIAIPCFVLLGYNYLNTLSVREQAVQTSFDAQSLASLQQTNLQVMNALLQSRFNQIFASLSGEIHDPSFSNAGGLVSSDIVAREADFVQGLAMYQTNYNLATSSNMDGIRSILINDNPQIGPSIISSQQQALNAVTTPITGLWPQYQVLQKQENALLDNLDPTTTDPYTGKTVHPATLPPGELNRQYEQAYHILWHANYIFTDLRISWLRVVDAASSMGKTVAAVGSSQTLPVYISIIFTCTILLIFALFWGFISFRPKRSFPLYSEGKNSGNTPILPTGSIPPVPQLP
jgi:hypothetical protein